MGRIREYIMQGLILLAVALSAVSADVHAPAHGYGYAPEFYCRDTNTSVYAEVCVPAFTDKVTPVTLAVKEVIDDDYCFDRVLTICEEKSETMKVTACGPAGYGYGHHGYGQGEHQVCHEEYQTQAYKVPLVQAPLEVTCSLAYPAPKKVCVTKAIEITEVKCEDKIERRCFNVAKFQENANTVDQVETIIGEPKCDAVTLTLPTQSCSKAHHAPAPYHG